MSERTYTAAAGETWDIIALKFYYDEFLMNKLIQANLRYAGVLVFEGGEVLTIPEIEDTEKSDTLPPWRQ